MSGTPVAGVGASHARLTSPSFGRESIKTMGVSPDAFMQMAMQVGEACKSEG